MSFNYTCQMPVRWKDIDSFRILNNAVYFTLIEQARFEYFSHLDLLVRDGDFPFVLGETACRFRKPGRIGMVLDVASRVTRLGNSSLDMEYEISFDGKLIASAVATLIWVGDNLKSTPIPTDARQRISEFEGIPPGPQAIGA
jgi:acyl-CoA thioester hydrolase